ncbi:MAG: FAD-binding protein [Candidatus Hydrogenedens sp.]|nr:FAD-binding protein [Candidatus Hydrogenedens sp.]
MSEKLKRAIQAATPCEVRWDDLSRQLYATDASIYQIEPLAAALPKSAEEAAALFAVLAQEGVSVTPRGAGTGLAGGALNSGVIADFARYNKQITEFDPEARTVRVGAGVVLDQLNAFLKPHGLAFGPDVATSSRATLGGMINNNSSGARAPRYGATIDHVRSLELVMTDGSIRHLGLHDENPAALSAALDGLIAPHEAEIRSRFHEGIVKRWPGYALDRYLRSQRNPAKVIGGSEGTLAGVWSAVLDVVPLPGQKALGLVFFDSVIDAMEATVELLDLNAAAIEHIDDVLFDQTRGQLEFEAARAFLELDDKPCKSILMVEFYEDIDDKLERFLQKNVGVRKKVCRDLSEQAFILELRKSGLSLLTGCKGDAKPAAGIEDVSVTPAQLPDYVRGLLELMAPLGTKASFYGHAASGLLHVRPVIDLHSAASLKEFRRIAEGVSALTKQFKGSLAAEHGVGLARTEFMEEHIGPELLGVMRRIKQEFDPKSIMNPGKIFPNTDTAFDKHLRFGYGTKIADGDLPFDLRLGYVSKDHSFMGNLEQCNGCGGCKKAEPTMCPTFIATGEDIMATRGRANTIRAVVDGRLGNGNPLAAKELDEALKYCLSCKACKRECPSNVDMALLKAELQHARNQRFGTPLAARMLARVDTLGDLASYAPALANWGMGLDVVRGLMERMTGIAANRSLPRYAEQRFDTWFEAREQAGLARHGDRGEVYLWDDCFVRHNEPNIGHAAVRVLEAAGFEVSLVHGRACCGRPAFSTGQLDVAADMGRKNIALLKDSKQPIIFLEPSCYSMFAQDYLELGLQGAAELKGRVYLFEHFVQRLLEDRPDALRFSEVPRRTAIHAHCHAKALTETGAFAALARRIPNNDVTLLKTGCCGMAGSFGMMRDTQELSVKVAKPLIDQVDALPEGTRFVASGTSCRHQIEALSENKPIHLAELLASALAED